MFICAKLAGKQGRRLPDCLPEYLPECLPECFRRQAFAGRHSQAGILPAEKYP
jgi:hypothetical protein